MAKVTAGSTKAKEKKVTKKDELFQGIGKFLAQTEEADIVRIKQKGVPEFLLVTDGEKDYTICVTEKKSNVEYEEDDVVDTFEFVEKTAETDETKE